MLIAIWKFRGWIEEMQTKIQKLQRIVTIYSVTMCFCGNVTLWLGQRLYYAHSWKCLCAIQCDIGWMATRSPMWLCKNGSLIWMKKMMCHPIKHNQWWLRKKQPWIFVESFHLSTMAINYCKHFSKYSKEKYKNDTTYIWLCVEGSIWV